MLKEEELLVLKGAAGQNKTADDGERPHVLPGISTVVPVSALIHFRCLCSWVSGSILLLSGWMWCK